MSQALRRQDLALDHAEACHATASEDAQIAEAAATSGQAYNILVANREVTVNLPNVKVTTGEDAVAIRRMEGSLAAIQATHPCVTIRVNSPSQPTQTLGD